MNCKINRRQVIVSFFLDISFFLFEMKRVNSLPDDKLS